MGLNCPFFDFALRSPGNYKKDSTRTRVEKFARSRGTVGVIRTSTSQARNAYPMQSNGNILSVNRVIE